MKQFSKLFFILFAVVLTFPALQSCKKGEQDPGISFKSRKARMVGVYTVSNANISGTSKNIQDMGGTCVWTTTEVTNGTFNGTMLINTTKKTITRKGCTVDTTSNSTEVDTFNYKIEIEFTKDGRYTWTTILEDPQSVSGDYIKNIEEGSWNFTAGVGDLKSKEQIVLNPEKITEESKISGTVESTTYTSQSENSKIYNLVGLRGDEIILSQYEKDETPDGLQSSETTTELTLTEE